MSKTSHENGLIIAYYGDGKGKTTASLGIAMRAVGRGMNVKILQFIKGDPIINKKQGAVQWTTGEREFAKQDFVRGTLEIEPVGLGFVSIECDQLPFKDHLQAAKNGMRRAREVIADTNWDVVVLDEILRAIEEKLVTEDKVTELIRGKPKKTHLVLTGHTISQHMIDQADMVTEMKKIKHPYDKGILAKFGIDY